MVERRSRTPGALAKRGIVLRHCVTCTAERAEPKLLAHHGSARCRCSYTISITRFSLREAAQAIREPRATAPPLPAASAYQVSPSPTRLSTRCLFSSDPGHPTAPVESREQFAKKARICLLASRISTARRRLLQLPHIQLLHLPHGFQHLVSFHRILVI